MRLRLISFAFLFLFFLTFAFKVYADEDFDIATNASYNVQENGITKITQTVQIKNKKEFIYTPTYKVITGIDDIRNLKTTNSNGDISNKIEALDEGGNSIEVQFPNRVIGVGNTNTFTISFETSQVAKKKGSVWEISIPGLEQPDTFAEYNITLSVPASFGPPDISKPYKNLPARGPYTFSKNEIGKSGILILFGEGQYYLLDLTYHITNNKVVPVKTEIALPPPTSYQDVRIKSMNPEPQNLYQDADGNWMAVYSLAPRQTKDVKVSMVVHVFSKPIFETKPPTTGLESSKYWEVEDPTIKAKASELKTPQAIYDFVVNTLSYNYEKVSDKNVRIGAKNVLSRPDFAVCLEFTDLFVTLARAAGIKARSVEGYADTENSTLRPLSLVQDVLHSWPEYYDETKQAWVMVDPTWGNTTKGMDYFNTFDFDHIAFVIKGKDSTYPIPAGGYKLSNDTKDVHVTVTSADEFTDTYKTTLESDFPKNAIAGFPIGGSITIRNLGNVPIKNNKLTVESDLSPNIQEFVIDEILPYGEKVINIEYKPTKFLTNREYEVKIQFDGNNLNKKIFVGLLPEFYSLILGGVIIIGSIIVAGVAYKTWNIYLQKRKG